MPDFTIEVVPDTELVNDVAPGSRWDGLARQVLEADPGKAIKLTFEIKAALAIARASFRHYVAYRKLPIEIISCGLSLYLRKKNASESVRVAPKYAGRERVSFKRTA